MSSTDNFIFWCTPARKEDEEDVTFEDMLPSEAEQSDEPSWKGKSRESMYVSLVESMVKTVLETESFLFSEEELAFFTSYSSLSYKARYLLARLLVRKTGKWYRLDQLKYVAELGSEGIVEAISELCGALGSSRGTHSPSSVRTSSSSANGPGSSKNGGLAFYAEDEKVASLADLLACLSVEELKGLARTFKLPNTLTARRSLIECLLSTSSAQTILPTPTKGKLKTSAKDASTVKVKQTLLSFKPVAKASVQSNVLRDMVLRCTRKCIRINDAINALFHRLHIIYFRSTEHPVSLLTPALLRRCRKRYYPLYTYVRTPEVFISRDALVAYENALRMEAAVDLMLEGNIDVELAQQHVDAWHRGTNDDSEEDLPPAHSLRPRSATPDVVTDLPRDTSSTPLCSRSASVFIDLAVDNAPPQIAQKETQTIVNAKYVISVFDLVYPRWQELVCERGALEGRAGGLERFDEGYILTRIVYKGATAFGKLKNFDREISLLQELLEQRRWRRGKRGAWYDRWALILMHHKAREKKLVDGQQVSISKEEQEKVLRDAMQVTIDGLHDNDTHIVYRQSLEARLSRLEKRLKVPPKERHQCIGRLKRAPELKITGERVWKHKGRALDKTGKMDNRAIVPVSVQIQGEEAVQKHLDQVKANIKKERWTGKSIWYGKSGEEVNVETLVLHHLEFDGYKGFHSEGSIISTIFGLLFWDILFMPVPGAFETPYQSAPLDIATECFFFARREAIEERLQEIESGKGPELLAGIDDKFRDNNTMCVGVHWNEYSKQDLVEIVTCLGGKGLSVICRLFCEDYGGRHSGIPDLICWRAKDGVAKFVEVKGPGDNLSENQKVWIHVLRQAGVTVEVCRVAEREKEADLMRDAPRKHKVIRVYRINEGKENSPIDIDGDDDVESEEELSGPTTPVPEDRPQKRIKCDA